MRKLNLGCGLDIKKGYVNLDFLSIRGVDVVHDLNKFPYPFKDNEFDEVYTSHVLEHIDDLVKVMGELKRICKPGARIVVRVPHFSCGLTYNDPTHKTFFGYFTFDCFTDACFYDLPRFIIAKRKLNFTRLAFTSLNYVFNPIININPKMYERFFCWILPCSEVLFVLEVIK
ncbi:MAG: class I SAM-dependent methyltransferase [Nanoarchaeota archaeon]|nr:class I SAM-dependent methyltransferase [Nanoarchaeota archaeon]MBU1051203.1 class I SAM-dependent methyltransferase [Nanoarchaeota archaeon]MBU1988142.1 class I SAM-dependent methyltransferase [Nanoarchaeota archaeon]